jgi:hypothetical protein
MSYQYKIGQSKTVIIIEKTMTKISSYQNVINGAPEFGGIFNARLVSSTDI